MAIKPRKPEPLAEQTIDTDVVASIDMTEESVGYWKNIAFQIRDWGNVWNQRYLQENQKLKSIQGMYDELANEFRGLLRKQVEVSKLKHQEVMSLFAAHKNFKEIANEVNPRSWFKITGNLILLAVAVFFVFGALTSAPFRLFLSTNAIWIAIVAIGAVGTYIYMQRRT